MSEIIVQNRRGIKCPYEPHRMRAVIDWACDGMNVNPIELEANFKTKLKGVVTTSDIQKELINTAVELCTLEEPDWRYVAGRLVIWNLRADIETERGYTYSNLKDVIHDKVSDKWYDKSLLEYDDDELDEAEKWINLDLDLDYDYAGSILLTQRYLLNNELPQEAYLVTALMLAINEDKEDRLFIARQFYETIAKRKISLATPILANLRIPNGSVASCFIISVDDSLESIYRELTNTARISKNGGGVGVNLSAIRASGSWVARRPNASGGIVPWTKLFNDTALAVNQGGRRAGAVTVGLDIWHLDIPDFLDMQTENGDLRRKAYDIFPQLVISDLFMERVQSNSVWCLVDPYEVKTKLGYELHKLWGEEFRNAYAQVEHEITNGTLTLFKKYNAKELFKEIMRIQLETGLPYLAFKDTINEENPNKHDGYIPQVNLCNESFSNVSSGKYSHTCLVEGSRVLTSKGWLKIEECDQIDVLVPYSSDKTFTYNPSYQKATLINQGKREVYRIILKDGSEFEVTEDHRLIGRKGLCNQTKVWKQVKDLSIGDKIEKYIPENPIPSYDTNKSKQNLTDNMIGWLIGDGWIRESVVGLCFSNKKSYAMSVLHPEFERIHSSLKVKQNGHSKPKVKLSEDKRTGVYSCISGKQSMKEWLFDNYGLEPQKSNEKALPQTIKDFNSDRISSILCGLFSADGSVVQPTHPRNKPFISLSSASLNMLKDVKEVLALFGIHSTINYRYLEERDRSQGSVVISGSDLIKFNKMIGLRFNPDNQKKLDSAIKKLPDSKSKYRISSTIQNIQYIGERNVYDLGLEKGHNYVAEGVIHHNCNLVSLNLANIEDDDISYVCDLSVRLLDNAIDLTTPPFEDSKAHNNRYRTIGVGAMGLADWLAKRSLTYQDLEDIDKLFEEIQYECIQASCNLAMIRGAYPAFEGSEWSKGKLLSNRNTNELDEKWDELAEDVKTYGVRNSHLTAIAPNTSSSLIQGCTASILPVYSRFFYDKWSKGIVPIAPPFIEDKFWFYQENKNINQNLVINATSTIQKWVDTGISMELLFNLNKPDVTPKHIYSVLINAWESGCKAVYYVRSVQKDSFNKEECSSCSN